MRASCGDKPDGAHSERGAGVKSAQDVVVTAHRPLDAQEARHFVNRDQRGDPGSDRRKFDAAVCPMAIGFRSGIERQIVARIRKVAKAVGAEVAAKERCAG